MNYTESLQYLQRQLPMFQRVGKVAYKDDLQNISLLLQYLEQPHTDFPSIHIAGTNGKGSTAHMMAAILQDCGLKVGLFTSPHYNDFRERIKINGHFIEKTSVANFITKHHTFINHLQPSFFELTVGLAFDYFREQKVDVAIIEAGVGGRADATNIITPLLSVITNVGFDHMNILGKTLSAITMEKAGIIKPNIPVIIGATHPTTASIFENIAHQRNAPIFFANQMYQAILVKKNMTNISYKVYHIKGRNEQFIYKNVVLDLSGAYQAKNLITVIAAIHQLFKDRRFNILNLKTSIKNSLKNVKSSTHFIGRWEILNLQPLIIADSGHNVDGLKEVMRQIVPMSFDQLHIILGLVNGKDLDNILPLFPKNAIYYFSTPNIPRGMDAHFLTKKAQQYQLFGKIYASITTALEAAKADANDNDLIFVGGSIYTVAEVLV